ncbi:hypothetical protein EYV94_26105 [Puteibacter caeruleilacunae]|nr:hypothetical protein EYV94_26105 [Puteibacter caeruleilacunae]
MDITDFKNHVKTVIKGVLKEKGKKLDWFCDNLGWTVSNYHKRLRAEGDFKVSELFRFAEVLNISVLRFFETLPEMQDINDDQNALTVIKLKLEIDMLREQIKDKDKLINNLIDKLSKG